MSPVQPPPKSASDQTQIPTASAADEWHEMLRGGDRVLVRPLHAHDIEMERRFIETLSTDTRRFRFLGTMRSASDAFLKQLMAINPATDVCYVAIVGKGTEELQVGVGRFSAAPDGHDCEFAVTVTDEWQKKGLGTLLMRRLIEAARARGIATMHSSDTRDNDLMRSFARHLHIRHSTDPDDANLVLYRIEL
jgi:GNAT superfamily N-acetyltransferase